MLNTLAFYQLFGYPVIMYAGIVTFLLFLATAMIGMLIMKQKIKWPLSTHIIFARVALLFGVIHAIFGMAYFLNK